MENKSNTKLKKIIDIAIDVVLVIFFVFALFITIIAYKSTRNEEGVPFIGKSCLLTVQSGSMSPTFDEGDLIIGKKLSDEELARLPKNAIITFFADLDEDGYKEINTHRISQDPEYYEGYAIYQTKGDANSNDDDYKVNSEDIISVWSEDGTRIKGLGKFITDLKTPVGFLLAIVLPMAIFFFYELYRFIKLFLQTKNEGKRQITAEDEEIKRKAIEEYLRQQQDKKDSE